MADLQPRPLRLIGWLEDRIMTMTALLIVLLTATASINRYFIRIPLPWYEEIVIFLYMLLVFWGSSRLVRDNAHIRVELIGTMLGGKARLVYEGIISLACLVISALGTYFTTLMALRNSGSSVYLRIPNRYIIGLSMSLGFLAMTIRYAYQLSFTIRDLQRSPHGSTARLDN
ncbi:MAG: TRAP transporter small permease [Limnochordia bacterium]|jgi:TRAP-type C4-dicarboxylate transport system permease small subunit|nr:TRAP transporter small permease [Bacillota bacterium]